MSLNGITLNSAALNSAALLALVYAEVSGVIAGGAVTDVTAYKIQSATTPIITAGAVATIIPTHNIAATSSGIVQPYLEVLPTFIYSGACNALAEASSFAIVINTISGSVNGTAGADGWAISASSLGGADFIAGATGTPVANKWIFAASTAAVTGDLVADTTIKLIGSSSFSASCAAVTDWQYQASGSTTWLHEGNTLPVATGVLTVDETKHKVEVSNGCIATAESSGAVIATKVIHIAVNSTASSTYTANGRLVSAGTSEASADIVGTTVGIRKCMAAVSTTASCTYTQLHNSVKTTLAGNSAPVATGSIDATAQIIQHGTSVDTSGSTGSAIALIFKMAEVDADAHVNVSLMLAYSNFTVPAPESRSMIVSYQDRAMIVPDEYRIMRMAA